MTAVTVGSSALFGEFCPSVPLAFIAPYTATVIRGLNPILPQIRALELPSRLSLRTANPMDSGTDGSDRSANRDGEPEPGQPWRGPLHRM